MYAVGVTYVHAIVEAGGTPVILPPALQDGGLSRLAERLDGLLLSGGEDIAPAYYHQEPAEWLGGVDVNRDATEVGLIEEMLARQRPILGICRGHQVLNVALGGTLYQDIAAEFSDALEHAYVPGRPMEANVHSVDIDADSRLAEILGGVSFDVNSAHHQAVREPAEVLMPVAEAPDGVNEALEMPGSPFCLSVQWHPEAMLKVSDTMGPLFGAFIAAAKEQM
jgi:putative glutamine amidotransferase